MVRRMQPDSISPDGERRRATTLDELWEKMPNLVSEEGRAAGLAFVPRPTDVIIASYAKSGTTWLQQIVHSLRTGGDLDFDDISRVVPWIETAADLGLDLEAPQRAEPRAYKSHLSWDDVPKGARYIVSIRDPRDALVSAYRFFEGWFFEPGTIDIEELGRIGFIGGREYYRHLESWWLHRNDPDVLLLAYEHMAADPAGAVRRVAEFMGFAPDDKRIAIACDESSLTSMKHNKDRYDDHMMRTYSEAVCHLPSGSDSSKVRSGTVGGHRAELSPGFVAELDSVWMETIGAKFGLPTYESLLNEMPHL